MRINWNQIDAVMFRVIVYPTSLMLVYMLFRLVMSE
jgi:hypothetical protein